MLLARILTPVLMQRAGIGDNAASANHDNEPYAVNIQTNGRPSLRIFLPPGFRQVIRFANVDGKVFAYHAGTPCVFAAVYVKERMELCNCGGIELWGPGNFVLTGEWRRRRRRRRSLLPAVTGEVDFTYSADNPT
jgi:hypothetical protein